MKKQLGLLLGLLFWANIAAAAFPAFKVQDIKLEGIQHVKPGVVFHHFPIYHPALWSRLSGGYPL